MGSRPTMDKIIENQKTAVSMHNQGKSAEKIGEEEGMEKGIKLNREQYKRVKRMDHKQMGDFICKIYNEGYKDGKAVAAPRIKPSDIATVLVEMKGVGTKKAAEIMAVVNKLYERGAQ